MNLKTLNHIKIKSHSKNKTIPPALSGNSPNTVSLSPE